MRFWQDFRVMSVKDPLVQNLKDAFNAFSEPSFTTGILKTFMATSRVMKFFWTFSIIVMLVATIWNTSMIIQDFLDYPVKTEVYESTQGALDFPTVTICNNNPVPCLKLAIAFIRRMRPYFLAALLEASGCLHTIGRDPLIWRLVCELLHCILLVLT